MAFGKTNETDTSAQMWILCSVAMLAESFVILKVDMKRASAFTVAACDVNLRLVVLGVWEASKCGKDKESCKCYIDWRFYVSPEIGCRHIYQLEETNIPAGRVREGHCLLL